MLVYGDRARTEDPRAVLARIRGALQTLPDQPAGIVRHAALVSAFIDASELAQGLADAAFEANGCDRRTAEADSAIALVTALARRIISSWDNGFMPAPSSSSFSGLSREPRVQPQDRCEPSEESGAEGWVLGTGAEDDGVEAALRALSTLDLPSAITIRTGEGYAFYALYPEAYAEAARPLAPAPDTRVLGLRSIGTGLAAMVAARLCVKPPITLRPVGHPFRRELRLHPDLRAELLANPDARFAVADEGPGLSGSSFGAVLDLLDDAGVPQDRITVFPSHAGDLGPQGSERHRARWATLDRQVVDFDALAITTERPEHRLERWVEDLTGPAVAPLQDISGGAWRALRSGDEDEPPANTFQERRKFLLESESGRWLLKFAGLGRDAEAKFRRAEALSQAGFAPPVAGLRHGFLVERWIGDAAPLRPHGTDRERLIAHLARYLAFRAHGFPASPEDGASPAALHEMTRANVAEALGDAAMSRLEVWRPRLDDLGRAARPIHVDARLHAFEWLTTADGRVIKTDAVDHSNAHDLVGCQDLAWDVAGAEVEFDMTPAERERFRRRVADCARRPIEDGPQVFYELCYLAFQLGLFSMAADAHEASPTEQARLRRRLAVYETRLRQSLG